jgi:catechol 2,3-dioxygenase-like lactoylglutathione lyase family enzyme
VSGVSELVLEVSELERAERFYVDMLGLAVVERWPHRNAVWVLAGETRIGLWEPQVGLEGSQGGKHVHFALHVADDDFGPLVETLRKRGLEVPVHEFGGLGSVRRPSRSAYVTDPDGHLVEFWTARMSDYLESAE